VAKSTLTPAVFPRTSPSLTNRKLMTAIANTSKNPSTSSVAAGLAPAGHA
jgi:hypothetical protein